MREEVKKYLKTLKDNNDRRLFLFYQFYKDPKSALGSSDDNTMDEYYKYGNIKHLIKCDDFFDFLNLCVYDEEFTKRLENDGINNNLLGKLRYIIFDVEMFKKKYYKDLEDENFREFLKGNAPIGEYNKKYSFGQLYGLISYYKECGWLYEIGMTQEDALKIEDGVLKNLKFMNNLSIDVYQEKYIEPIKREKIMIDRIKNGEYSELDRVFYLWEGGCFFDKNSFKALICSNKFLVLCKDLLNRELSYKTLEKIMNLLEMSIDFHNLDFDEEYEWLYNLIGERRVTDYNGELANEILDKFESKISNSKVIKLY